MTVRRLAILGRCVLVMVSLSACGTGNPASPATVAPGPTSNVPAGVTPPPLAVDATLAPTPEPPVAARVNGEPIYLADYEKRLAQYQEQRIAQGLDPNTADGQAQLTLLREEVLDGMIDDLLVAQEARLKGVTVSDEQLEAAMQAIIADGGGPDAFAAYLAATDQTEADIRAGQRASMLWSMMIEPLIAGVPGAAPQVHARHILVDSADLANSLLAQLQAGADFTSLTQQYSQESLTRDGGGDLGWFLRGGLISKEVEDAAFALQPGQYSGVVQSAFGFHIIQVIEVDPGRPLTDEQLRQQRETVVQQWLASLRAAANIEK